MMMTFQPISTVTTVTKVLFNVPVLKSLSSKTIEYLKTVHHAVGAVKNLVILFNLVSLKFSGLVSFKYPELKPFVCLVSILLKLMIKSLMPGPSPN